MCGIVYCALLCKPFVGRGHFQMYKYYTLATVTSAIIVVVTLIFMRTEKWLDHMRHHYVYTNKVTLCSNYMCRLFLFQSKKKMVHN